MLKVSPWKELIRFGKQEKLNPRYIRPFKILAKVGTVVYRLKLLKQLSRIQSTFHVSNLKKCLSDETLFLPLEEIQIDNKLYFIKESVKIMYHEVKHLKQIRIPIAKVRWNSIRSLEFTWESEDQFQKKYMHLFPKTVTANGRISCQNVMWSLVWTPVRAIFAYIEYGIKVMLVPRSAKALQENVLPKVQGTRKRSRSLSLGGTLFWIIAELSSLCSSLCLLLTSSFRNLS
nr:putative reverse transcriptase domain-containing protein [Tanacetum cinerariifolium]